MMMPVSMHDVIPVAVERVLDSLAGGLLLCALAWAWLRVARRQNSASRFFILFILLVGIAVLPLLGISWLNAASSVVSDAKALITLPARFAEYLFIAWATIATGLLARIAVGFIQLNRLKRSCKPIDLATLDVPTRAALRDCTRTVELCISDKINVPTALGLGSPARIAIPAWLMDQLSPEELHHLVLHELAHLRRRDDWSNLAQRVLGAVLFFHPAIWWLQGRLSLEREMACDECVLAETGNARAYARSLANMAERSFVRRTVTLAQAAVSRLHDTTLRVAKILNPAPQRHTSRLCVLGSAVAFGGISLAVALYSPDLIGFTEPPSHATLASIDEVAQPMLRAVPASFKLLEPAAKKPVAIASKPKSVQHKPVVTKPEPAFVLAKAEHAPSLYVPAKHTQATHSTVAQPAMLVVWQETVSDDGSFVMIQQTYWRVVVYHPVQTKEPAKIT